LGVEVTETPVRRFFKRHAITYKKHCMPASRRGQTWPKRASAGRPATPALTVCGLTKVAHPSQQAGQGRLHRRTLMTTGDKPNPTTVLAMEGGLPAGRPGARLTPPSPTRPQTDNPTHRPRASPPDGPGSSSASESYPNQFGNRRRGVFTQAGTLEGADLELLIK
jgi:hypothetical protein